MTEFGEKLRRLRKKKGLTIRKLSELSGVAHSYLSQVETGNRGIPKVDTLEKIASGLNIPSLDLLMLAGYLSEKPETQLEIRSLPDIQFDDLEYYEIFFKGRVLTETEKTKIKKIIEIALED
jgi:HTH-type transcriptional regulator, competence development regulator